jgi:hypothetical protein
VKRNHAACGVKDFQRDDGGEMEYDYDALEEQRAKLRNIARSAASDILFGAEKIDVESLVDVFAELRPPQVPEVVMEYLTIHPSGRSGSSRKAGNLLLSWSKLMDLVPDVTIAGAGALSAPAWTLPFIGRYIWNKVWRGTYEILTDLEASIILAFWKNRDPQARVEETKGRLAVTSVRNALGLDPITDQEYRSGVDKLIEIGCIEMENGVIVLRESVRVKY